MKTLDVGFVYHEGKIIKVKVLNGKGKKGMVDCMVTGRVPAFLKVKNKSLCRNPEECALRLANQLINNYYNS